MISLDDTRAIKPRIAGLFMMPMRWVCGWVLFAAAWRRLVLKPEALDPHSPLYEGIKLNHFLPHAFWIHGFLNYVILHPWAMLIFLWCFTLLEAAAGILLFVGLGTRLLGLVLIALFINLMLVAGWLGSTCLDEWTVATFGIAIGVSLFLSGSGPFSVDALIFKKYEYLVEHRFWGFFISPELSFIHDYKRGKFFAVTLSILTLGFILYTNQYFVGGVYGPFHNPAISMNIKAHAELAPNGNLALTLYRNQGPDTYGAFIVNIAVKTMAGNTLENYTAQNLGDLDAKQITNFYLTKAAANTYGLVLPLGALVTLNLNPSNSVQLLPGQYRVTITDVSGKTWQTESIIGGVTQTFNPFNLMKIKEENVL